MRIFEIYTSNYNLYHLLTVNLHILQYFKFCIYINIHVSLYIITKLVHIHCIHTKLNELVCFK